MNLSLWKMFITHAHYTGVSVTDIPKRDLCNIFTDCLVHPTHYNWNTVISCCISIILAKSSVRFFTEKKYIFDNF